MAGRRSNVTPELALQANRELENLEEGKVFIRLLAISRAFEMSINDVASFLRIRRETISRWVREYRKNGISGLRDRAKGHYPSKLKDKQKEQISQWLLTQKDSDGNPVHWTIAKLRLEINRVFGISISYTPLRLHLHKMGFVPKVPRPRHIKADQKLQVSFKKKWQILH